jgi:hypothetical protein
MITVILNITSNLFEENRAMTVLFKIIMHVGFLCDIVTEAGEHIDLNEYDVKESNVYSEMMAITYAIEKRGFKCVFEVV